MDIKDLNKPQVILLALLLSFIASIATSIMTVSMMQQAPASVTVPINRIVQQTVEKIQQVEGKTITQTVVVKEEDLVVDAIAKNQSAIFIVTKETIDEEDKTIEISAGKGIAVTADGIVAVDGGLIGDKGVYYVKNESGKFKADFTSTSKEGFSFIKIGAPLDDKNKLKFTEAKFGDMNKMKAGQKVIILGNGVSSFVYDGNKDIKLSVLTKSAAGGMVLNLEGEVIGMALMGDTSSFVSANAIQEGLKTKVAEITP